MIVVAVSFGSSSHTGNTASKNSELNCSIASLAHPNPNPASL